MTTAEVEPAAIPLPSAKMAERIGQATAVEQARAVAEVAAAVKVAQDFPRSMARAEADMHDACNRLALAERAFYRVPNRGEGPSVHLARELARIWGNIQYGVHELRRDDVAGESEVQAFAWDVQTNSRSVRTFIVPHARMAGGQRKPLTDLNDIYLSNQNTGARAVRECIFTVLPTWFVEEAIAVARTALERGNDEPIEKRRQMVADTYAPHGVSVVQLETKVGRKFDDWTPADVAQLGVIYQSIGRGETTQDEEFPPARVTAAEITGGAKAAEHAPHKFVGAGDLCATCDLPLDAAVHGDG